MVQIATYSEPIDEVASAPVTFYSEGTRLSGEIFYPKTLKAGDQLPGIVLCHGWGGLKRHLTMSYAPTFAARGYVVLAFDYRGWGASDARLLATQAQPKVRGGEPFTIEVRAVRELVDPLDQLEDIRSALNVLEGDARVDKNRLGVWGTSLGGGLAISTAARDDRVRCVVSQVGFMDGRLLAARYKGGLDALHRDEIRRSRGELDAIPRELNSSGKGLRGTPYLDNFARFAPVLECKSITIPLLLIDVEYEELFDIRDHSGKVYNLLKNTVDCKQIIIPGANHYDVYRSHYGTTVRMALDWFDRHLRRVDR